MKRATHVAIIKSNSSADQRAIIVPPGQSLDFDPGEGTRRWLWPYLRGEWHLMEFLEVQQADEFS